MDDQGTGGHLPDLIDGCRHIPHLAAYAAAEGRICLVLDGRLGLELPEADACAIIPFIADCIDVALGRRTPRAPEP